MFSSVYFLALLAALSDIIGGLLPLHPKISRIDHRYVLGFASGIVVSVAFFELIPEGNISENYLFLGLGFFLFYLVEKVAMLHSCGEKECEVHSMGWVSVLGMASDNILDGIAIAVSYLVSPTTGLLITLAVVAHEIPQGITTTVIMRRSGSPPSRIILVLVAAGLMYPLGVVFSRFIPTNLYELVIAFVAGEFIYVGASDLLTEAHKKFNATVVATVILGGAFFFSLESIL